MATLLYKILRLPEWKAALETSDYTGSEDDVRDGFIHFSSRAQLEGTLNKYFSAEDNVMLLAFEPETLSSAHLKWEPSRGGALFPHLYAPLDVTRNSFRTILYKTANGLYDLSSLPEKELS